MTKHIEDDKLCLTCQCEAYRCRLQQKYIYLESNLNSKNGLVSEMFQRRIISFQEKRLIEKSQITSERNRQIIDLFFDEKNHDQFLLFLECLAANNQGDIRKEIESTPLCRSDSSSINDDSCFPDESNLPTVLSHRRQEKHLEEVGRIVMENKLAVMGLCVMKETVYVVCHRNPHVSAYLSKPPFYRMTFLEFDLPISSKECHFYDMVCYREEDTLIVSDKANCCLWVVNVAERTIDPIVVWNAHPLRMSISNYALPRTDSGIDEDIYSDDNVVGARPEEEARCDSATESRRAAFASRSGADSGVSFDIEGLTEDLLLAKLSSIDKSCREDVCRRSVARATERKQTRMLVAVTFSGDEFCVDFYDLPGLMLKKRYPLLLGSDLTVSNVVQKKENGRLYVCYGKMNFDLPQNSWYLGEYSSVGKLLNIYSAPNQGWVPRFVSIDERDGCIYAVRRFPGEIVKLTHDGASGTLEISTLVAKKQLCLPSRICFTSADGRGEKERESFLFVGQGEIESAVTPASVVVLRVNL